MAMEEAAIITARSELPGFRFHPTEEELLNFYLKSIVSGKKFGGHHIIGFLNIYKYDPTELPGLAKINGEREWYFFVPRDDRKHAGGRPNRTTEKGFWKATGSDRQILDPKKKKKKIMLGLKKTLVFYEGRAPRGRKTDWVMNEYRLPADNNKSKDDQIIVLCKIYMKARSLKALEHRAAIMEQEKEEETKNVQVLIKKEDDHLQAGESSSNKLQQINLAELQVPKFNMLQDHWTQDSFWTQFSPWIYSQFYPLPAAAWE